MRQRLLTPEERAVLLEVVRRGEKPDVAADLFDKQRDLAQDKALRKAAVCSRRAGKTYALTRMMLDAALGTAGCRVAYVCDTYGHSESLVWLPMLALLKQHKVKAQVNNTKLRVILPNGSIVQLSGCSNEREAEKLLGHAYKLVIIDEAQSFPLYLKRLINEVLGPAMADYAGQIVVAGTPEPTCTSYFYEITDGAYRDQWSTHRWTVDENPCFPRWSDEEDWQGKAKDWLAAERALYGYAEDDPAYLRDYRGLWARSDEEMILSVPDAAIIPKSDIPDPLVYVLGIDLGFKDEAAFVVGGYSEALGRLYEVDNFAAPGLTLTEIVDATNKLIEKYSPLRTVVDPARSGNALVEEINQRWGTGAKVATKKDKGDAFTLLKNDILSGKVFFQEDSRLAPQLRQLRWNKTFTREMEGIPCDLADAFLYLYRESLHWIDVPQDVKPEQGSHAYWERVEQEMIEREDEAYRQAQQGAECDFY